MKAYIDGIYSVDLPSGSPSLPESPEDCWIIVQADIGAEGFEGTDTFTFYICTIKRLERIFQKRKAQFGRHMILVERFDWEVIESSIENIVSNLEACSWEELAEKINEYGEWEFEDITNK